jgi:hypothetical protein
MEGTDIIYGNINFCVNLFGVRFCYVLCVYVCVSLYIYRRLNINLSYFTKHISLF